MARCFPAFLVFALVLGLAAVAGCGGTEAEERRTAAPPAETPRTISGPYEFVVSQSAGPQGYVEILAGVLEFPEKPDGEVRLARATDAFPAAKLILGEIKDDRVRLVFAADAEQVDFEGVVGNGGVWGSFCVGGLQCTPARLVPQEDSRFGEDQIAVQAAGSLELQKLERDGADFAALLGFCRRNSRSPAAFDVYAELVAQLGPLEYTEKQTRDFAAEYFKAAARWGERMEQIARLNVGNGLVMTEHLPRLGMEYLREAESKLRPEQAAAARRLIDQATLVVRRVEARELIGRGEFDEALAMLQEIREKRPLDPQVAYLLAVASEKSGRTERALELYGEVVALPQSEMILINSPGWQRSDELPGQALRRLWNKERGGPEGLEAFLDRVYVEAVSQIAESADRPKAASGGSQVALGELFTGAQCPPCVAADVAGMALEATYPRSELIVLRYHQHIPAEDPLANDHTARRFAYYVAGPRMPTPTFVFNGRRVDENVGGFLPMAEMIYGTLRRAVDPLLAADSKLSIQLSTSEQDGTVALDAAVESDEPLPENLRLRLALAEDDLSFAAQNGIRQHRLIVRHMPGEPEGTAPSDGRLAWSGKVSLSSLRTRLLGELERFEEATGREFPVKPMKLRPLYVVAFVQDDQTKEVLQAAGVPVGGAADGAERSEGSAGAESSEGVAGAAAGSAEITAPVEAQRP